MGYHVLITVMGPALFSKKLFGLPICANIGTRNSNHILHGDQLDERKTLKVDLAPCPGQTLSDMNVDTRYVCGS